MTGLTYHRGRVKVKEEIQLYHCVYFHRGSMYKIEHSDLANSALNNRLWSFMLHISFMFAKTGSK